ncbi:hypothetical protein [Mesorhizobium sp. 8]|uniref:hypothetical protein n=1 Tax=Mesorhizobium sp. 8 TaxID=2584466 RepID=UPI0015D6706D|nr:hypothetical protein [Mesorhizobium sp. 8]
MPRHFRPDLVIEIKPSVEDLAESNGSNAGAQGQDCHSITEACAGCAFAALAQG